MLKNLAIEFLGLFIWTYASLMVYRLNDENRLSKSIAFGQGLVDFIVVTSFYFIGQKISGSHLNPLISLGSLIVGVTPVGEVL